jgi:hypothetical protein
LFEEESPVFSMRWNCRKTLLDKIRKYWALFSYPTGKKFLIKSKSIKYI